MGLLDGSDCASLKTLEIEDSDRKKVTIENSTYVDWMARDQLVLHFC
jgi:hypothetical protein